MVEDFDSDDLTIMNHQSSVEFEKEQDSTPSRSTGPDDDHTTPNDDNTGKIPMHTCLMGRGRGGGHGVVEEVTL